MLHQVPDLCDLTVPSKQAELPGIVARYGPFQDSLLLIFFPIHLGKGRQRSKTGYSNFRRVQRVGSPFYSDLFRSKGKGGTVPRVPPLLRYKTNISLFKDNWKQGYWESSLDYERHVFWKRKRVVRLKKDNINMCNIAQNVWQGFTRKKTKKQFRNYSVIPALGHPIQRLLCVSSHYRLKSPPRQTKFPVWTSL
jgi:hypothetical protein